MRTEDIEDFDFSRTLNKHKKQNKERIREKHNEERILFYLRNLIFLIGDNNISI